MQLSLYQWNSQNINDGTTLRAYIPPGQLMNLSANAITVPRAIDFPFLSTTNLQPHTFTFGINIVNGQSIHTNREIIKKYFNVQDKQRHNLVAKDTADSDRQWYLTGFPIRVTEQEPNHFIITLTVEMPVWRVVTPITFSWDITASGQSSSISNIGNVNVKPVITVTPTDVKTNATSYTFRRFVTVYNNLATTYNAPLEVGGPLDTATLTTTKMQADRDDLRVIIDGVEVDRWLQDMDTSTTEVWVNVNLSPKHEGTLKTSLANSGDAVTVAFNETSANLKMLQHLATAANQCFLIESELFTYDRANVDLANYQITACARAQKDSSFAAHTGGSLTIRHIEHDIWIIYGNPAETAPDTDDTYKPIFALTSTNSSWVYTNFSDTTSARPGAWKSEVMESKSGASYVYTATEDTTADPSTTMGMALLGSTYQGVPQGEDGLIAWSLYQGAGFTSIVYEGSRFATDITSFPSVVGLQRLDVLGVWNLAGGTITAPSTTQSWQTFATSTTSGGTNYKYIRFVMDGSLKVSTGISAKSEFDTVTVGLATPPTVSIGAETATYWFTAKITNITSGEWLYFETIATDSTATTIDCDTKKAYRPDGAPVIVTFSDVRESWLDLSAGTNNISFTDLDTAAVTLAISHTDRTM